MLGGYDYANGMSNRAVAAYDIGIKPLSKITLDDLRNAGWAGTKSLAISLAKAGHWVSTEWHHTGGTWFNRADFYDPEQLIGFWNDLTPDERDDIVAELTASQPKEKTIRVTGSYTEWGGSRRRPRKLGEVSFTGTKKGDWIFIDDGGRKKASGRWISWSPICTNG
tara:strand:+ start:4106 stop:4603 length:498 start_codon:yes stop_codon:yes gene_type:complete